MQDNKDLTKRQKEVLTIILKFITQEGRSPTFRELAKLLKTGNVSTAQYFVEELQKRGYLRGKNEGTRGISPINKPKVIQLLGYIAAGNPIEPMENPEEIIVPNSISLDSKYPHYALRVRGTSMVDMGILPNDIVLIKHQLTANTGDVVVAITENGATLKVYKKENGRIILEAKNKDFPNIIPKKLEIRGKFIGLIRPN
jgi:repressor LexA